MILDMNEIKKMAEKVDGIVTSDERAILGLDPKDDTVMRERAKQLMENDIAQSQSLTPLIRMVGKKTLFPWQGKESDSELAFNFENVMDAQDLHDFVINAGLVEPGEVKLHVSEHQVSVHFTSGVMVNKPEVIQAALLAYYDFIEDTEENDEAMESLVHDLDKILVERTKISGAPKGRAKGNPFHDKKTGKFSGADDIDGDDGGSFAVGKVKLKYTGAKKSKKGDLVVNFGSTKHPCGRAARKKGKDIRCWDGKKGMGIRIAKVMGKRIRKEEITDDDLRGLLEVVDYFDEMMPLNEGKKGRIFHFKGDKVQYTGKSEKMYGGMFYEFVYLEGHKKGKKGHTPNSPDDRHPGLGGKREDVDLDEMMSLDEVRDGVTGHSIRKLFDILLKAVKRGDGKDITMWHDELKAKGADMHLVDLVIRTGKFPAMVKRLKYNELGEETNSSSRKMSELIDGFNEAVDLTFDEAIEELVAQSKDQDGVLTRLDVGKELKDIGKNSSKYMKKAFEALKKLGVKIVSRRS